MGHARAVLGGKKAPNGASTLFLASGSTVDGFVSRPPGGLIHVTGEDTGFGGAFAAIDVVV